MSDYRILVLTIDGQFVKTIQFDCADDGAAIEYARQFIDGHDIELWQRDRRVARFNNQHNDTNRWLQGQLKSPD